MAKKIKKQIKRSMPLFVVINLLFSTVGFGLIFDLGVEFERVDNGLNITFSTNPDVLAQSGDDFATTTVTVKNAPPTFSVVAAETPVSASNTPTNMWASQSFTANANDPEGNSYYLIVCDTANVTASTTGGAPTCDDTTLCVSPLTGIAGQATCVYSNVQDPGGETQDWYAYVCDNHTTEGVCSDSYSQGTGESGSPMYVNHPPYFNAVYTMNGGQDPGGSYTITASSTDPDVASSADYIIMDVCLGEGYATSTGCTGVTLCTGTSTSPDVSCSFATTTPALDGSYTYYAYVRDEHFLAATSTHTNNYVVNNVAPQVTSVVLHDNLNITLTFKGEDEVHATTTATITDANGCADITHATGSIYWSGATGLYNCQPDDNDCYQIGQADCWAETAATRDCTGYTDSAVDYTCSTTIAFHALPTDVTGTNPNSGTWWLGAIQGFDEALSGVGTSAADTVDVLGSNSLNVSEVLIPYGSIRGGQDSANANATTTVENYGNIPIDTQFEGVDMDRQGGGGYIGSDNQRYATSTFTYPGAGITWQLASGSLSAARDLDLAKPTTTSFTVNDAVYWGIQIPAGKLSGIYDGSNYFQSTLDDSDW